VEAEAIKFLWKRKHFKKAGSGSNIGSIRLFDEPETCFIKHGRGMWKRKHFEQRSWKQQTRKRLTLYGAGSGSKKYSAAFTNLLQTEFQV